MSARPTLFAEGSQGSLPALRMTRSSMAFASVARWLAASALLFGIAMMLLPWQQNVAGHGRVIGYSPLDRTQAVQAPVSGRIVRWRVSEGARVRAGDPLVEVSDNDPTFLDRLRLERTFADARVLAAEDRARAIEGRIRELSGSREMALSGARSKVAMAKDRVVAAQNALDASLATQRTAQLQADRVLPLADAGIRSMRDRELAELDLAKSRADVERARAALSVAEGELNVSEADLRKVGTDTQASIQDATASLESARSELAKLKAELNQAQVKVSRQESQAVLAPRDGTILRLVALQDGQMVKAGDDLAWLVPDTEERAVELWVDGNDVPLLEVGRPVRLQFEGWPAIQFVGWPSVAVGTFGGTVALIDSGDNGKGDFRIVVQPDPADEAWPSSRFLRQGGRANGWIMLNRVPLGYELWRQFNGFPPIVAKSEPQAGTSPPAGGKKE